MPDDLAGLVIPRLAAEAGGPVVVRATDVATARGDRPGWKAGVAGNRKDNVSLRQCRQKRNTCTRARRYSGSARRPGGTVGSSSAVFDLQAVLFDLAVQGRAADTENFAGPALVASRVQQHALDVRGLDLVERPQVGLTRRRDLFSAARDGRRQLEQIGGDLRSAGPNQGSGEDVFELPDIAGPGMVPQPLQRLGTPAILRIRASASIGMSAARSRSAGMWIVTTLRR